MGTPAFVVSGDLAFDGITYETALASVDVFVAAVADLCGVDASLVSVDISQARRRHLRRRLDDAGSVVVTYTVAVETEAAAASVSTLIEDSSTEDVSAAVKKAATEAGVDEDFADVETTAVGMPTTALAPQPDDDAPTTSASEGSSGGGGGPDAAMSAGIGAVGAVVLLALFGGGVVWRRRRAKAALRRGGEAATLRGYEETGYDPKAREELLQRHKETTAVVERGMTVTSALLGAASGLPLVGPLCQVVQGILGDVEEFSEKADDVLVAARRVIDVLDVVDLMSKNVSKCSDGKDIAQANMQRLIDLLKEFHAAVRAFGQKGWLKRAFTMQSHVKKLGLIDKRIVEQLGVFRLSYRLAIDSQMMERTYQIEQSIAALVAKRVVEKGESEEAAAAALSEDAVAITSVAVDARVPPTEIAVEMREFRLEVKEGLSKLDKKMNKMLDAVHNQIVAARLEGHRVAAWSLTARFSQHGRVLADKGLREELSGAPDSLVDLRAGWMVEPWTSSSSSRSLSPSKPAWDATRSSWRPSRRARRATSGSWRPSRLATNATRLFDETSTSSAGRCGRRSRGSWSSA